MKTSIRKLILTFVFVVVTICSTFTVNASSNITFEPADKDTGDVKLKSVSNTTTDSKGTSRDKGRATYNDVFASKKGKGYTLNQARSSASSSFVKGDYIYVWGYLHDINNNLYKKYGTGICNMTLSIYRPNGSLKFSYTYKNCDNNWIGVELDTAGTWKIQSKISGALIGNNTQTISVKVKSRPTYNDVFASKKGKGYTLNEARSSAATSFKKGDYIYVWGYLHDVNNNLYKKYGSGTCNMTLSIYRPDGTQKFSYTYKNCDNNWIGVQLDTAGTWKIQSKISGALTGTNTQTIKVTSDSSGATKYRALLIGNSNYSPASERLNAPKNDSKAMAGMFKEYGYAVTIRNDLSAGRMVSEIRTTFRNADSNDISVFYYSGHGNTKSGALSGVDNSSLSLNTLADELHKIPGRVVIILDSCGSGGGVYKKKGIDSTDTYNPEKFNQMVIMAFANAESEGLGSGSDNDNSRDKYGELRNSKFLVLTASKENEVSYEYPVNGYWGGDMTRRIVEGAGCSFQSGYYREKGMPADSNRDRMLSLKEVHSYAAARVKNKQHVSCYPSGCSTVFMRNTQYAN